MGVAPTGRKTTQNRSTSHETTWAAGQRQAERCVQAERQPVTQTRQQHIQRHRPCEAQGKEPQRHRRGVQPHFRIFGCPCGHGPASLGKPPVVAGLVVPVADHSLNAGLQRHAKRQHGDHDRLSACVVRPRACPRPQTPLAAQNTLQRAGSGDLAIHRQATWGIVGKGPWRARPIQNSHRDAAGASPADVTWPGDRYDPTEIFP